MSKLVSQPERERERERAEGGAQIELKAVIRLSWRQWSEWAKVGAQKELRAEGGAKSELKVVISVAEVGAKRELKVVIHYIHSSVPKVRNT